MVCEPICVGMEHSQVNAGVLETIQLANSKSQVTFVGEKDPVNNSV